jgi:hypothetical protein
LSNKAWVDCKTRIIYLPTYEKGRTEDYRQQHVGATRIGIAWILPSIGDLRGVVCQCGKGLAMSAFLRRVGTLATSKSCGADQSESAK